MQESTCSVVPCTVDNSLKHASAVLVKGNVLHRLVPLPWAPPESYLLRGPIEQAPVPQGFVSCGVLIHFVIGVRWEPHLQGSDKSQRWVLHLLTQNTNQHVCPRSLQVNLGALTLAEA